MSQLRNERLIRRTKQECTHSASVGNTSLKKILSYRSPRFVLLSSSSALRRAPSNRADPSFRSNRS